VQQIYFTSKDDTDDTDVFQKEYLEELYHLQNSIESKLYEYDGKHYNISDYCYKPINGKGCYIASPMDYWKMDLSKMLEDPDIKETAQCVNQVEGEQIVCSDRNEIPIIRNVVFGGIDCITGSTSSCDACRIKANALAVTILLMNEDDYIDMGVKDWEKDVFEDLIDDFNDDDSKKLQASYYSERSVTDELEALNEQNYLYVVMSYVFMFLYISVAIGQFPSKLHTK
jgi:Niemann-Pick C1 protein